MKGIPVYIQTRADLNNLFALTQTGEISKAQLAEKVRGLLSLQYHRIPVLSSNLKTVTTKYFSEVKVGDVTLEGLPVTAVEHKEAPADENTPDNNGTQYAETVVTLSKAYPAGKPLEIYKPTNFLTENGFDVAEMNYILGVLEQ